MTPEEAIKLIEIAIADVKWNYLTDYSVAFETAIEALEKQVAKKPKPHTVDVEKLKIGNANWCKGTTVYRCPNCNDFISRIYDFCHKCGQALDWSDNNASFYNLDIETAFDKIRSGIDDGTWYFGVPIRDFLAFLVNIEGCEVIGNIHDNPELLRGDANA